MEDVAVVPLVLLVKGRKEIRMRRRRAVAYLRDTIKYRLRLKSVGRDVRDSCQLH
ncbi:hypothetical protein CRG98_046409 [Punica granatum]|uniref:Uncharacterized protein n=1 Tax=Punica granatum TaxID=22663 RepID=A0A2I0HNF0_PUNGR|nr:hypothetical protein CRG98_046409 [Punica granatum]